VRRSSAATSVDAEDGAIAELPSRLLRGVRVVELGQIAAGPFAASLLGDLGADVIKVEPPERGDGMRSWPPFRDGPGGAYSENFASVNRSKRSVVLDLKTASGRENLHRLIDQADVVVENYRPGVLSRLGFDYEELRARKPSLVYCSISGYGATGPFSGLGAFDVTIQAASGLMDVTGEPGRPPVKCGVPVADFVAGLYAVVTVLACIRRADQTGTGAFVDCSMLGAVLGISALQTSEFFGTGRTPGRLGADHPRNAPYGTFDGRDRPFVVAAGTAALWEKFCEVLGRPDLVTDERFATQVGRARAQDVLRAEVAPIFAARDASTWIEDFKAAGIPCALVATVGEALQSAEVRALGVLEDLSLPNGSRTQTVGFPVKVDGSSPSSLGQPPELGAHTEEVLREWLSGDRMNRGHDADQAAAER
jgi:succinate---hydroxymethylglutarate CoA-transferase